MPCEYANIEDLKDCVVIRPMEHKDTNQSFCETLSSLFPVKSVREVMGIFGVRAMIPYFTTLVADAGKSNIVGTASFFIEPKYRENPLNPTEVATVGHIEDVAIHRDWQGMGLGQLIVAECKRRCFEDYFCYRVTLNADESLLGFYERVGFQKHSNEMRAYAKANSI